MDAITLDQFTVLQTIVEEGSFAAAARKLGRAQSAITYAVQKLEDQSGVTLFDRTAYRPTLTEQGRALLPRIQRILDDVGEFRVQAQSMSKGVEAELIVVVETFLPLSIFMSALRQFHSAYPMVQLRINAVRPQDASRQLLENRADLGLFLLSPKLEPELESLQITEMDFVAVAAPDHPLTKLPPNFPKEAMRNHLQIVVSDPEDSRDAKSYGVVGVNQWRVSDVRLRLDLVKEGLGWGSMPRPMVDAELARGDLMELQPKHWDSSNTMPRFKVVVARRKDRALGPAGTALMSALACPDASLQATLN